MCQLRCGDYVVNQQCNRIVFLALRGGLYQLIMQQVCCCCRICFEYKRDRQSRKEGDDDLYIKSNSADMSVVQPTSLMRS